MSSKGTAGLVALLVALSLGYWLTLRFEKQEKVAEIAAKRLFDFEPEAVTRLTVTQEGQTPTTGEKRPDGWVITAPRELPADGIQWSRMAILFSQLRNERTLEGKAGDLGVYALDTPRLTVEAATRDGRKIALAFGKLSPTQQFRYARMDDGPVFLVQDMAYGEFNRSLLELRNRHMVDVGPEGVTKMEFAWVRRDTGTELNAPLLESVPVVVEKKEDGRWFLERPIQGAANPDIVINLAAALHMTPGRDYVDNPEDLKDYQLQPPLARLTAWTGHDKPTQTLYFGTTTNKGEEKGLFVKRADSTSVFTVPATILQFFPKSPDSWRERRLLTHLATEFRTIRFTTGGHEIVLENSEKEGWKLTQPGDKGTDQEAVSGFVAALKAIDADEFLSEPPPNTGLDAPQARIHMVLQDGSEHEIRFGNPGPEDNTMYATQDTGAVALIRGDWLRLLRLTPFDFQAKDIFKFSEASAVKVILRFDATEYVFERVDHEWVVRSPAGSRWDVQSDMKALLAAFNPVNAVDIEGQPESGDPARFGFDAPILSLQVVVEQPGGKAEPVTLGPLTIGAPTEGDSQKRYATVAGRQEVFLLRQKIVDDVREALTGVKSIG